MKHLGFLLACLIAAPAIAQYVPAQLQSGSSAVGFQPLAKTSALAASTTSGNIALASSAAQMQIFNSGTGIAFVIFCATPTCTANAGTVGTSTSDYPVAAGSIIVMTPPSASAYVAVVMSSGTSTIYVTPGVGL